MSHPRFDAYRSEPRFARPASEVIIGVRTLNEMKTTERWIRAVTLLCFATSAVLFSLAVYRQNILEIGFGSTPRLALLGAGMMAGMVAVVSAMLMQIPSRKVTFAISVAMLLLSITAFMSMKTT